MSSEPLTGLSDLSTSSGPWATWARGVCLAALGSYDDAVDALAGVCESAPPEPSGLAAAAIGSVYRELGAHDLAIAWDDLAISAEGAAVADGLIGRTADEIGLGHAGAAASYLARASAAANGWRDEVRLNWVRTELSLLADQPVSAINHAGHALSLSIASGSPKHSIKSRLFLLVARDAAAGVAPTPSGPSDSLAEVAIDAAGLKLRPLAWSAVCAAGAKAGPDAVAGARDAIAFIDDHLPAGADRFWLDRADIAWLR
ncbi:MAG: hypothetical protein U0990_07345 [Candidatus Nanopelagicales bacterium]|nr:hypothetical protein [Candidatus Nanopelagicales bacterium]MDZ4249890.1 hypothetical protein [Candidatus Nanopelagicales bacterium]